PRHFFSSAKTYSNLSLGTPIFHPFPFKSIRFQCPRIRVRKTGEVRWHLAQILPRLELTKKERQQVFNVLVSFLDDDSRIVKTFAMQGLADIAETDRSYLPHVVKIVEGLMASGIPAIQSRGKKLLPKLTEARANPALNRTRLKRRAPQFER
ncbi:MAG: hypothetical protein M1470_13915, partial [Bacteroidetes bacterium]|nr:hypothetical protein [Bacteroidota bacterium]MCL5738141.1 hypothetical protein [Bacteroidota bacterium]